MDITATAASLQGQLRKHIAIYLVSTFENEGKILNAFIYTSKKENTSFFSCVVTAKTI